MIKGSFGKQEPEKYSQTIFQAFFHGFYTEQGQEQQKNFSKTDSFWAFSKFKFLTFSRP